eukprot:Opistho-2@9710
MLAPSVGVALRTALLARPLSDNAVRVATGQRGFRNIAACMASNKKHSWAAPAKRKTHVETPADVKSIQDGKAVLKKKIDAAKLNTKLEFMPTRINRGTDFSVGGVFERHKAELQKITNSRNSLSLYGQSAAYRELTKEIKAAISESKPNKNKRETDTPTGAQSADTGDLEEEDDREGDDSDDERGNVDDDDDVDDAESELKEEDDGEDPDFDELTPEEKEIEGVAFDILQVRRVVCVRAGGKERNFSVLAVAGNEEGAIGFGSGKSDEPDVAAREAALRAARNLVPLKLFEGRTLFNTVRVKVGAVHVEMRPAAAGKGLVCHHVLKKICQCAGITDISANVRGSGNPLNIARAALLCFEKQLSYEDVARRLGRNVLKMRKDRIEQGKNHPYFGVAKR